MEYTLHQQELLDKVKVHMKENNLSQADAAVQIGISKTALSQLFSKKYNADPQKMFDTLEGYFSVKERSGQTYQEVILIPDQSNERIQSRPVILLIVSADKSRIVSQSLWITLVKV